MLWVLVQVERVQQIVYYYLGDDIPYVPNKRTGGLLFGGKIAPIFSIRWKIVVRCQ